MLLTYLPLNQNTIWIICWIVLYSWTYWHSKLSFLSKSSINSTLIVFCVFLYRIFFNIVNPIDGCIQRNSFCNLPIRECKHSHKLQALYILVHQLSFRVEFLHCWKWEGNSSKPCKIFLIFSLISKALFKREKNCVKNEKNLHYLFFLTLENFFVYIHAKM